jgi:hypothetical protein
MANTQTVAPTMLDLSDLDLVDAVAGVADDPGNLDAFSVSAGVTVAGSSAEMRSCSDGCNCSCNASTCDCQVPCVPPRGLY